MIREEMLARLVAQACEGGTDLVSLRAIIEEASELGAARMLERMGLGDSGAQHDLSELREVLRAWHDAKKSAWKAVVAWVVRVVLAMLMIGIAVRGGLLGSLK